MAAFADEVKLLGGYLPLSDKSATSGGDVLITLMYPGLSEPKMVNLYLKPSQFNVVQTNRSAVFETETGAFVTNFGMGLGTISISGNTGWRLPNRVSGKIVKGSAVFAALRGLLQEYANVCAQSDPNTVELILHNTTEGGFGLWRVTWSEFRAFQDKNKPLVVNYEVRFDIVEDLLAPPPASPITQFVVGALSTPSRAKEDLLRKYIDIRSAAIAIEVPVDSAGKSVSNRYYFNAPGGALVDVAQKYQDTSVKDIANSPRNSFSTTKPKLATNQVIEVTRSSTKDIGGTSMTAFPVPETPAGTTSPSKRKRR